MRTIFIFFCLLIALVIFQGCCKVYCPRQSMTIAFVGFGGSELDSIIIRKFEPGGFTSPIHTRTILLVTSTRDTVPFPLSDSDELDLSKNYEIELPGVGRKYHVSDIKTQKGECMCGQKDGKYVAGYIIDGQTYQANQVYVKK